MMAVTGGMTRRRHGHRQQDEGGKEELTKGTSAFRQGRLRAFRFDDRLDDLHSEPAQPGLKGREHLVTVVSPHDGSSGAGEFGGGSDRAGGFHHGQVAVRQAIERFTQVEVAVQKRPDPGALPAGEQVAVRVGTCSKFHR